MKTRPDKIKFIVEKTDTGFSAFAENYPVYTTGTTIASMKENGTEALNLYLKDRHETVMDEDIQFEIDIRQFFTYYRVINAKFLARRIGMNETLLSQYVQGHKKPSSRQVQKILRGIQEIGKELADINLVSKSEERR
jgi:predicted RNase H-like HicB family nuclease